MHSYDNPFGLAIINWMLSTDSAENWKEKGIWVVDGFHKVGQEGHTLTLKLHNSQNFQLSIEDSLF